MLGVWKIEAWNSGRGALDMSGSCKGALPLKQKRIASLNNQNQRFEIGHNRCPRGVPVMAFGK